MKKSLLIVLVLGFLCFISIPQESAEADSHLPFPDLVNELFRSGDNGSKMNLVIIGDGFQAGADQVTFDAFVENTVMEIFNNDVFAETKNAFNVYSLNLVSVDSGVTQIRGNVGANWGAITSDIDGDGIPYRTYPGTHPSKGSYFTRGSSHDANAAYTEDGDIYAEIMDRISLKFKTAIN